MAACEKNGAETVKADLSILYAGLDDPRIEVDITKFVDLCESFHQIFKSKLRTKLGDALCAYGEISALSEKVESYLFWQNQIDTTDESVKTKRDAVDELFSSTKGKFLTFFELEIVALDEETINRQARESDVVARHIPWLIDVRKKKPHMLPEAVEATLIEWGPYGPVSWSRYYQEAMAGLRFTFQGEQKTLHQMLEIASEDSDARIRADALAVLNAGLTANFLDLSAQTLNMVVGEKRVEDRKRGYKHPMDWRNQNNKVPDLVAEALHIATRETAAPLARAYYRLKGAHLGRMPLLWSDRNAPLPFADASIISYEEAIATVIAAYESFSPTMAEIVQDMVREGWIDARVLPEKRQGAFSLQFVHPGGTPVAFTFLNYAGNGHSVMTLAHELGHGVHGILAGRAQGPLMCEPPMAYAETASMFGETVTFKALKAKIAKTGDTKALLALLMDKIDHTINATVRQISFSNFERRVHEAGRRLSPDELNAIWVEVTKELYGEDGDVFSYKDMDALWSYVHHFHYPFYVYSYSFGDFLVSSLYATQDRLGDRFEPLYLDLLRAGGSKDAVELLAPFGLDPTDPEFWNAGIEAGLGAMVAEAEQLSEEMGVRA